MSQDITARTVRISDLVPSVKRAMKRKRPVFIWGPPGVGKSEVVEGIATELGGIAIDIRLGMYEPTDIRGMPYYDKNTGKMVWAPPIDLPTEEMAAKYPVVVLFLDEMNQASPSVQGAAFQLILNRKVGQYTLPENVVVVAAGNRETDKGVTFRMPTPLRNRFTHLELAVNFDDWQDWAVKNNIHPDVVGYLNFAKSDLFDFDPRASGNAFASPRSWTFVSEYLYDEEDDVEVTDNQLTDLIAGTVGEGIAVKFNTHRKFASKLPVPTDILDGKIKELPSDARETSAMYTLTVNMAYELKQNYDNIKDKDREKKLEKWHDQCSNVFQFMMDNFQTEMNVLALRIMLKNYNIALNPRKLKNFSEFAKRYGDYIKDA